MGFFCRKLEYVRLSLRPSVFFVRARQQALLPTRVQRGRQTHNNNNNTHPRDPRKQATRSQQQQQSTRKRPKEMYTMRLFLLFSAVSAWTPHPMPRTSRTRLYSAMALPQEEQEEEWEYLEYEDLQESDFVGSEWLVGTNYDNNPNKIVETWARCIVAENGKQPCIWGDGSKGTWSFDRASQYFSLSKEYIYGKTIWAGVVEDYYYLQGTVRGWTYVSAAQVVGQWQAKRLGVDPEEAGTAPWFEEKEETSDMENDEQEQVTEKLETANKESEAANE